MPSHFLLLTPAFSRFLTSHYTCTLMLLFLLSVYDHLYLSIISLLITPHPIRERFLLPTTFLFKCFSVPFSSCNSTIFLLPSRFTQHSIRTYICYLSFVVSPVSLSMEVFPCWHHTTHQHIRFLSRIISYIFFHVDASLSTHACCMCMEES